MSDLHDGAVAEFVEREAVLAGGVRDDVLDAGGAEGGDLFARERRQPHDDVRVEGLPQRLRPAAGVWGDGDQRVAGLVEGVGCLVQIGAEVVVEGPIGQDEQDDPRATAGQGAGR
ncbi:hypothetical protein [Tessaracoccus defluvii]|uniref:hypothetical protein n=1 Tax=Tessaracoccus defluvii TaxID=1285901 RepID=UPI001D056A84|nr:hypothetical protein [Tessaracoccus defluvii]